MAAVKKIFLCSLISVIIFTLGQTSGVNAQVLPPYQFIRLLTADVVNQELIDQGRATPQTLPFLENSQVTELSTAADGYYIRYYSYDPSRFQNGAVGGWMMPIPEVLGKSLPAVKDLFALPQAPDHFVVVKVPAGTLMRTGTSGPISGWGLGGGQQVLLMEYIDVSDYQTAAALPAAVRSGAFAPQAGGENAQNSATYIDSLAPDDPFSYLQIVRFSLSYLEGPAFDKALNNIGPECYDVLNRTGLEQGFMFEQILLDPASRNITSAPHGSYSMWGGITGSLASYDGRGEHTGFDLETGGAAAGFDLLLNPNLSVGLGLGCLKSNIDLARNGGSGESRSLNLGLRGTYQRGQFYIAGQISGAILDEQLNRELLFSGVNRCAHGDSDGYRLATGMKISWRVDLGGKLTVTPYTDLSLIYLVHQGLSEDEAEDLNLKVRDFTARTFACALGIKWSKEYMMNDDLTLSLNGGLAYAPRFVLGDRKIKASFVGQGGTFSAQGEDEDQHGFRPSLNLAIKTQNHFQADLDYVGSLADNMSSHTFSATLGCRF